MTIPTADSFTALVTEGVLAQLAERPDKKTHTYPTGKGYWMEPKANGWRIIAHIVKANVLDDEGNVVEPGQVNFYSRAGNSYNGKLPKIEAELLANFPVGTWLDGEAVATRVENGKVFDEWKIAQSVLSKVGPSAAADKLSYAVFDLLAHRGIDARSLPLVERRRLLDTAFADTDMEKVWLMPIFPAEPQTYESFVKVGYEGAVVKRAAAVYGSNKREGGGWTKVKPNITIDAVVMDFKAGENGFKGLIGSIIFGQHDPDTGELIERGKASGMDMRTRVDMTEHPEKWLGKVVEFGLVAPLGGAGNPPQFKRLRPDKSPEQVVIHDA